MIIVSQGKNIISNFDNSTSFNIDRINGEYCIINNFVNKNDVILGAYANEQRAKEVLEEIARAYSDFKYYSAEDGNKKTEIGIRIYTNYKSIDLYEMPED